MCQKVELITIDEYESHIGYHLEQLAVSALSATSDSDGDDNENVNVETDEDEERPEDCLEQEPRSASTSAEVDINKMDNSKVQLSDTFIETGPVVKRSSEEEILTGFSKMQVDDPDMLSGQHREKETKPRGVQKGHSEIPRVESGQSNEDNDQEPSVHGNTQAQSSRKGGQESPRRVDPLHQRDEVYLGGDGEKSRPGRSKYVQEKMWNCAWCNFGPLDWTYDTHCPDCGRPRDQYCRVHYQTRKVRNLETS